MSASRFSSFATSDHGRDSATSDPPLRSAHSPRSRLMASASFGSLTTNTFNATLARGVADGLVLALAGAVGCSCGHPAAIARMENSNVALHHGRRLWHKRLSMKVLI